MADPNPALEAALDAAGARGAGLRSALRGLPAPAVALPGRPLTVRVATFNAAGKPPPPGLDLGDWLGDPAGADLVAVTLQEAVPLSAGNVVSGAVGASGVGAWLAALDASLGPAQARLATSQLVGLVLAVWAGPGAAPLVRGVQATAVGGGGGGLRLGNKGLAAVRCLVGDAPVIFLGAHLPSGDGPGDAARRDACLADCLKRGAFPAPQPVQRNGAGAPRPPADPWRGRTALGPAVAGAAAAFLAGDLNYRLLAPDATVRKALRAAAGAGAGAGAGEPPPPEAALARLVALDELSPSAVAGRGSAPLFAGWAEAGRLAGFLPTFKLRPGGGGYAGDGGEAAEGAGAGEGAGGGEGGATPTTATAATPEDGAPLPNPLDEGATPRTPAWTDRVLFRAVAGWGGEAAGGAAAASDPPPPLLVTPLSYSSSPSITLSDHAPVAASLALTPFTLDPARLGAALEAARRDLDAAEMEAVPRCEAAPKALPLGGVPFSGAAPVRGGLVLVNTGRVPADWELAPQPASAFGCDGDCSASLLRCPPWLGVHPTSGTLAPGEAAAVEVRVVGGCARGRRGEEAAGALVGLHAAAGGAPSLDAVLILRVEGGNDEFVLVSADPAPSCFGAPLRGAAAGGAGADPDPTPPAVAALVAAILTDTPPPAALARAAARAADGGPDPATEAVRRGLDGEAPSPPPPSPPDAAASLFTLLACLPAPLLPPAVARVSAEAATPALLGSLLRRDLPPPAWATLASLSRVAGGRACPPSLAAALAPLLLPPPSLAGVADGARLSAGGGGGGTPAGVAGLTAAAAAADADADRRAAVVVAALAAAAGGA